MKKSWIIPFLALISGILLLDSCTKDQQPEPSGKGYLNLSFAASGLSGGRVTQTTAAPAAIFITLEGQQGNPVLEKKLPLMAFGNSYTSEKIPLEAGHYQITGFLVLDAHDSVLYAAPITGSPSAVLVSKPLPIPIEVGGGHTTSVNVEVASVKGQEPTQFGYSTFGYTVVDACELSANVDGRPWCADGNYLIAFGNNPQLFILNARSDTALMGLEFRANAIGTYTTFEDGYYFSKSQNRIYSILSGSITLSEVTTQDRATGTFQFKAFHKASGDTIEVKNGTFHKVRGMGHW